MQDCKQPRLDFAGIPQLVAFGRPDIERLLREITCVGLRARQAQGESVKRFIVLGHDPFKIIGGHKIVPMCRRSGFFRATSSLNEPVPTAGWPPEDSRETTKRAGATGCRG